MKARILHTKFWIDSYIRSLSREEQIVFLFLITNDRIGLSPIYEYPQWLIEQTLNLSGEKIVKIKKKFEKDKKFLFHEDWILIINADKYQTFKGEKNEIAMKKELANIPKKVKDSFLTRMGSNHSVSIRYL